MQPAGLPCLFLSDTDGFLNQIGWNVCQKRKLSFPGQLSPFSSSVWNRKVKILIVQFSDSFATLFCWHFFFQFSFIWIIPLSISLLLSKLHALLSQALFLNVVLDSPDTDLLMHFDECFSFIDEAISSGGNVLVHCFAGRSRSVTIVVAYLMKKHRMSLESALSLVRSKRPQVAPNEGFISQLENFEKSLEVEQEHRTHSLQS